MHCSRRPTSSSPTCARTRSTASASSPSATLARHPRLVYGSVSGYGLRGDDRNRSAYDIGAFWARSGLSVQLATNAEGVPLNARGGIGDHISGLATLAGLLAAVLEQRQTGRGRVVEVSLLRTGAYVLGWDLSLQANLGKVAPAEARQSEPDADDELVPDQGRALVLLHRPGGRSPHRQRSTGPSDARTCLTTPASRRAGAAQEPRRGHRGARRHHRAGAPRACGRSVSTAKACGGHRRRGRPRCSRTRSSWPTTVSSS